MKKFNYKDIKMGDIIFIQRKDGSEIVSECADYQHSSLKKSHNKWLFKNIANNKNKFLDEFWGCWGENKYKKVQKVSLKNLILYTYIKYKSPRFFKLLEEGF
jgi:hypothetical protein